jgi:hypothetical protein
MPEDEVRLKDTKEEDLDAKPPENDKKKRAETTLDAETVGISERRWFAFHALIRLTFHHLGACFAAFSTSREGWPVKV